MEVNDVKEKYVKEILIEIEVIIIEDEVLEKFDYLGLLEIEMVEK